MCHHNCTSNSNYIDRHRSFLSTGDISSDKSIILSSLHISFLFTTNSMSFPPLLASFETVSTTASEDTPGVAVTAISSQNGTI